jgi:putative transcriptional regulator
LETIRNLVKDYRTERGVSQQELATRVGVTRQTIISLEKGNYVPSLLLAINLSEVLETPLELLFIKEIIR